MALIGQPIVNYNIYQIITTLVLRMFSHHDQNRDPIYTSFTPGSVGNNLHAVMSLFDTDSRTVLFCSQSADDFFFTHASQVLGN